MTPKTPSRNRATPRVWSALLGSSLLLGACSGNDRSASREDKDGSSASPASPGATPHALVTGNTIRREPFGCFLSPPAPACDAGEPCKSAASFEIDCPAVLKPDQSHAVSRRPAGKEDWLRVHPWIYFDETKSECAYKNEWFCSPPGKFPQCMPSPPAVAIACARSSDAHTLDVASFVYVDSLGTCHKVPKMTCKTSTRGLCDLPEGEVVPCSEKGAAPPR